MENDDELEELEDLEDVEDSPDNAAKQPEEAANEDVSGNNSEFFTRANLFDESIFPVFFINRNLNVFFANSACENLLPGPRKIIGQYFTDLFGKFLNLDDIKQIRKTISSGENGYSWKGEIKIKTRETVTTQAKLYLFPLDIAMREPNEFVFMFDDVTEENRRLLRSVFLSLLEASKLKDNDTGRHITRVNKYSQRLSQELFNKQGYERIDADFIDTIGFLASMHDVGKIGTPDDILNKEGPLSDWEWAVMQEHTKNGAFILSTYPNPMAIEIALSHHERWNGSGYPFSLEGDMIPLSSRIVAIADVYDALRMKRSYKPAIEHEKAVTMMMDSRGVQFDPVLLDAFYLISDDFKELYEANKDPE
jgi:putative two-component system response regulator